MAVSLAGKGPFTDFHQFKIVKPEQPDSTGWIIFGAVFILILFCVMLVSYYYKHKIALLIRLMRRQNDTIVLMKDIEPTDFHEISLHHKSFDQLSDIMEFDE